MKSRSGIVACILVLCCSVALRAQVVRGRVVDSLTGAGVLGTHVVLVDDAGRSRFGVLADEHGNFVMNLQATGRYTLRAEMIGRRTVTSAPFDLTREARIDLTLQLPPEPIRLDALDVRALHRCQVRPAAGLATETVWEEARKALAVEATVRTEHLYRFNVTRYERTLDAEGRQVVKESASFKSRFSGDPFVSLPADQLATHGYVAEDADAFVLYGPNGDVLLSESFLDTHCLRLRRDAGRHPGQIGLEFAPAPGRRLPDVQGVLWLDQRSAELRTLEFGYTRLPRELPAGRYGGDVEFQRLPDGAFIVRSWQIWSPIVGRTNSMFSNQPLSREVLTGQFAEGGEVLSIIDRAGRTVQAAARATLIGEVRDSATGEPVAGAAVYLANTNYATVTDSVGQYRISDLPEGRYAVTFRQPLPAVHNWEPMPQPVELRRGHVTALSLVVPLAVPYLLTKAEMAWRDSAAALPALPPDDAVLAAWLASKGFTERLRQERDRASMTSFQIRSSGARTITDLLRLVKGVAVHDFSSGGQELRLAGGGDRGQNCALEVFLNGAPVRFGLDNRSFALDSLLAVTSLNGLELYDALESPVATATGCGALLLWSWRDRERVEAPFVGVVSGRVLDESRAPVAGVRVSIGSASTVLTDAAGNFLVPALVPGVYDLHTELVGRTGPVQPLTVRALGVTRIDVPWQRVPHATVVRHRAASRRTSLRRPHPLR